MTRNTYMVVIIEREKKNSSRIPEQTSVDGFLQIAMPAAAAEADIIQNRINVALARSQRLVASWLPPSPDSANVRSAEEIQKDEDALFTPIPPRCADDSMVWITTDMHSG